MRVFVVSERRSRSLVERALMRRKVPPIWVSEEGKGEAREVEEEVKRREDMLNRFEA